MKLCTAAHHPPIVYARTHCPLCKALAALAGETARANALDERLSHFVQLYDELIEKREQASYDSEVERVRPMPQDPENVI